MENTPANLEWIRRLFADPTKKVVGHWFKFDLEHFHAAGIDVFEAKCEFHCTGILAKMWNCLLDSYELKDLVKQFFGRESRDKTDVKDWLKSNQRKFQKEQGRKPTFRDAPREMVKRRNLWDAYSTLYLFKYLYPRVMSVCAELYDTERNLQLVVVDMQSHGVEIDLTRTRLLRAQANLAMAKIKSELNDLILPLMTIKKKKRRKQGVEWTEELLIPVEDFNPGSPIHKELAFRKLGIPLLYRTKPKKIKKGPKRGQLSGGGRWCFDEYAMIRYVSPPLAYVLKESGEEGWSSEHFWAEVHRVVDEHRLNERELVPPLILKYNELQKMVSTYYDHFLKYCVNRRIEPNGREIGVLHCHFNQSEAMTGRFSSSDPNLQNQPRLLGPRECFVPRRGRRNWHFDYEQVEMRFFCHFARDRDMADAIEGDIHLYVATQIYGLPPDQITKEQRKRAKAINFGILYGAGGKKIAETLTRRGLHTTPMEGTMLVAKYHRRFPSIKKLMNELKTQLSRKGFILNPFGRRYHIDGEESYKCINYICQGTPADLMKRAMVKIWRWLRENNLMSKIIVQVHDELVLEMPRNEEELVVNKVIELMQDLENYFVPMTVGCEIAPRRWSEKIGPKAPEWNKLVNFEVRQAA